jgi:hypothetical protein
MNAVSLGRMIEEALNDSDDTELMSVVNSLTEEQIRAILKCAPEHKGGVYSLTPLQWESIASTLQGTNA